MGVGGGGCVHMYTKYEVSMSNHVPGGGVHRQCHNANKANTDDANNRQSMIV